MLQSITGTFYPSPQLAICLVAYTASTYASPLDPNTAHNFGKRDPSNNSVTPQIYVPIIVVVVLLLVASTLSVYKRRAALRSTANARGADTRALAGGGTREVTAEQLAGGVRSPATNTNATTTTGTAGRNRRPRRARRTPSQISTHSLPEYMKEPGAEEVVIFRGPQDMEDAVMPPTTIIMPPVEEQEAEGSLHSRGNSEASASYPSVPESPNDEPLLERVDSADNDGDISAHSLMPPGEGMPRRRSTETLNSSEETSSLIRVNSQGAGQPDPRGEAPAYFEVVEASASPSYPPAVSNTVESSPSPEQSVTPRRSGFRSFIHAFGGYPHSRTAQNGSATQTVPRSSAGHARGLSGLSGLSSEDSHNPRSTHRPSNSGSGSMLSLSPFRTISRQRSNVTLNTNLNSPSLISLNSISAPLTHTLVRSEFTYPKAGPTPEQLKLISSRESFARFGVPYGADAIAFAASSSRHELEPPPPDFDAPGSETHLPRTTPTAGPSRLRSSSSPAPPDSSEDAASEASQQQPQSNTPSSIPNPAPEAPNPSEDSATFSSAPIASSPTATASPTHPLAPPTSYKMPYAASSIRSDSRASVLSYATAPESAGLGSESDTESDAQSQTTHGRSVVPTTPTLHVQEPTDTTVTYDSAPNTRELPGAFLAV